MLAISCGDIIPSPEEPSDKEISDIIRGDKDAAQTLLGRWEPVVEVIARRYISKNATLADLQHAARVGIFLAALGFDPARGVPFARYAKRAARNQCIKAVKMARPRWEDTGDNYASVNSTWFGSSHPGPEVGLEKAEIIDQVQQFISCLPALLQHVYRLLYIEGKTQRDAATTIGLSQPRVALLHQRLKKLGADHLTSLN